MKTRVIDIKAIATTAIKVLPKSARSDILSFIWIGSSVTKGFTKSGDIDLVLILKSNIQAHSVFLVGKSLRKAFSNALGNVFLFCDPICEQCELTKNRFRVHLIPHLYRRIKYYIKTKNPVVCSWAKNYRIIYGKDYLRKCIDITPRLIDIDEPWGIEDLREYLYSFIISKEVKNNISGHRHFLEYLATQILSMSLRINNSKRKILSINNIERLESLIKERKTSANIDLPKEFEFVDRCLASLRNSINKNIG